MKGPLQIDLNDRLEAGPILLHVWEYGTIHGFFSSLWLKEEIVYEYNSLLIFHIAVHVLHFTAHTCSWGQWILHFSHFLPVGKMGLNCEISWTLMWLFSHFTIHMNVQFLSQSNLFVNYDLLEKQNGLLMLSKTDLLILSKIDGL